mmetsp:Transcript_58764/g.93413  ORF Transcript_58764/g.93413 Transcript_58764/m.93413 type:complete len:273 (-) Transcript_58764:617-1435(-)
MDVQTHASLKPGSWIRIPIIYDAQCSTEIANAYHHAIIICPLLEIGFNAAGRIVHKLHITSTNKLYDCSKYEVIKEPSSYEDCEEIIRRAMRYYGTGKYSQMFNNCEHFASYCFNNKSESKQVKQNVWNSTTHFHEWLQNSSVVTNSILWLSSYNVISEKTVDKVCESNHEIGKVNEKIIEFCQHKAEENKIENQYHIKKLNDEQQEEQKEDESDQEEQGNVLDINEIAIVKDAKFVQQTVIDNLNEHGKIKKNDIDNVIEQIKPILQKYYE